MMRIFRRDRTKLLLHLLQRRRGPMFKTTRHRLLRRNRQQEKPKQTHHPQSTHWLTPPGIQIARLVRWRPELSSVSHDPVNSSLAARFPSKKTSDSFFRESEQRGRNLLDRESRN